MKKSISFILFLLFSFGFSQNVSINPTQYKANKWRVGGGIGLGFGSNDYFGISITPFVSYEIAPSLEGGISTGYQYSKWSNSRQNLFNIGPYLNYYPIPNLFTRVHYEYYTGKYKYDSGSSFMGEDYDYNFDESALWLGAGYRSSGKIQFFTGLMYNVLYDDDSSIFSTGLRPIVGVSFGL